MPMADSLETAKVSAQLSVIIPITESDARLSRSLETALTALSERGLTCEVIIVAPAPLEGAVPDVAGLPAVRFVSRERGSGWGDAVLAASAQARHDLICTLDATTLYAAAEVPRLVHALTENNAAMAVGVRIGVQQPIPARRRLLPWIIDMLASDALGRPLPDVNSGFRVVRRSALEELAGDLAAWPPLPAALTLLLTAKSASVLFVPLDEEREAPKRPYGSVRETLQVVRCIFTLGLAYSPRRTVLLIGRMAIMMLMMAAMMGMMMWMLGMLPGQ